MRKSLYEIFGEIPDGRKASGLRHPLPSFLTMVTMGIMSGLNGYQELAAFFKANEEEFVSLFDLKHGVAGYTQIRTILRGLNYEALSAGFHKWTKQSVELNQGDWVSGDGKGLNSTVTDPHGSLQSYVAMVSLFTHQSGLVFAVKRYEETEKEEKGLPCANY